MEKEAQPYYDVVHSKKFGYLFIQYFPEGDGDNFMTPLEDSHDLLFKLFSWITLDVLALDLAGERMTTEIFPVEAEELPGYFFIRRTLLAVWYLTHEHATTNKKL